MNKKIILDKKIISKKLEGDRVVTVYQETTPRYSLQRHEVDSELHLEDLRNFCALGPTRKLSFANPAGLNTTGDFEEDAEAFLEYCKEKSLTPYVVNVYDHSGCSFSFAPFPEDLKNYNTRHGWDSYCCGFVGVEKETNIAPETLAGLLSDIYNGDIQDIAIYDNLDDEVVDAYTIFGSDTAETIKKYKAEIMEKYGLELDI